MAIQLICALTAVLSAMNLFVLSEIYRRIARLEDLFMNSGLLKRLERLEASLAR